MNVLDLFPPCLREDCEQAGIDHKHILPQQQEILDSQEKVLAAVGGYGSGKTLPLNVLGHLLSISIPGNMGIVVRKSLPKLHDSTERIYLEVLQRSGIAFEAREMRDGWPHRIIYPNGSEVFFRPTADLGRFLGPEYGWFYIDEAQEEPEKTFKDLMGRLRLPRAAKYLKAMMATNPPSQLHWIARRFPKPGAWTEEIEVDGRRVRTTFRMIRSSTKGNPFLDKEYVAGLMLTHTPAEVKKIIEGFYGFSYEGKPVYGAFQFEKHVGDPPIRMMTLMRVWDFGYHRPACTWHQMFKCKRNATHWVTLYEYLGEDQTAESFGAGVIAKTALWFPEHPQGLILDGGDAAGAQTTDSGPGPIIRLSRPIADGGLNLQFRYRKFPDVDTGLDLVRECLKTVCPCGFPLYMIHRRCQTSIEGLAGGYHYPKPRPGVEEKKKPVKDGFYDNPLDTIRYAGELFYREARRDPAFLEELLETQNPAPDTFDEMANPWDWIERVRA